MQLWTFVTFLVRSTVVRTATVTTASSRNDTTLALQTEIRMVRALGSRLKVRGRDSEH